MTKIFPIAIIRANLIPLECCRTRSGQAENRKSGANPERYRHCICVGCTRGESRSLGERPEKAVCGLTRHKSGDLLKVIFFAVRRISERRVFVREKRLRQW